MFDGNLTVTARQNATAVGLNNTVTTGAEKYASISAATAALPSCKTAFTPGGTVDHCGEIHIAAGMYSSTSEVDFGDSSLSLVHYVFDGPVTLTSSATGSGNCGFKLWPNSTISGPAGDEGGLSARVVFESASGASPYAIFCTSNALSGGPNGYFGVHGILVDNANGVTTTSGYESVIAGTSDQSRFDFGAIDAVNSPVWVHGACCESEFHITANGTGVAASTVVPLTIGGDDQTFEDTFFISADHPGGSEPNVVIQQGTGGSTNNLTFIDPYLETFSTTSASEFVKITGGSNLMFISPFCSVAGGTNREACISIAGPVGGPLQVIDLKTNGNKNRAVTVGTLSAIPADSTHGVLSWAAVTSGGETYQVQSTGGMVTPQMTVGTGAAVIGTGPGGALSANAYANYFSSTAPIISWGFNMGSISSANGTASFVIMIGTGRAESTGVLTLPTAAHGWNCMLNNQTRADLIQQTANTAISATFINYGTTFSATKWRNSDVLTGNCAAN